MDAVATRHPRLPVDLPSGLLVDGTWTASAAGATFRVHDPATGAELATVADARAEDATAALEAAVRAQRTWRHTPPRVRADILRGAYDEVRRRRDEFAALMTLEMGKPLAEAQGELDYGTDFLRWFSEEAVRIDGGYQVAPNGSGRIMVMRQPVGPCLLITPWNFPLAMATRKIAPAIAAGCTMIIKPSELTPLTTLLLSQVLIECGLPPGVLNVLTTTTPAEVTRPLLDDGRIRKLSFTGSTEVGRILLEQCGRQIVRTSMELGGNAPFLVFADADLDAAVDAAMLAKLRNMGEACTAANRFYVQRAVAADFAKALAERFAALRLGHGLDDGTQIGPLIEPAAVQKVDRLVGDAVGRGARVLTGGRAPAGPGFFYPPTVLDAVPLDAELMREEIFGPVAPVIAFDSEQQAIDLANDTEYGLVAYVFTKNLDRAVRVSEALDVGMVGLNQGIVSNAAAPFGGVKASGLGREGGSEGIAEYLDTKYVALNVSQ
ncbi:NAD-dependent succinate-semialdehyde dehydrogenase [Rugosimonospora acidiphila]|uniref:NAD-dependent succinate-semialdehyde dehydrogenase n=1 Tax=Rugosimonospora acidiphila TaxID=556531 RepID=A0ABP9S280_9ACTN